MRTQHRTTLSRETVQKILDSRIDPIERTAKEASVYYTDPRTKDARMFFAGWDEAMRATRSNLVEAILDMVDTGLAQCIDEERDHQIAILEAENAALVARIKELRQNSGELKVQISSRQLEQAA
jgi:hypothetical protein